MYKYHTLYDFLKDDWTLLNELKALFEKIGQLSTVLFQNTDNVIFLNLGWRYYTEKKNIPLKELYCALLESRSQTALEVKNLSEYIATMAYYEFGANWEAIYKAYFLTPYKPLENYDMEQVRTPLLVTTNSTTRKQETKVDTSGKTKVVPFNSSTSTLTGESEGDSTTTEDKLKNEIDGKIEERGTDKLTRHGNIGVTTSQQMLQSELDLRKLDFINLVFRDLDRILLRNYVPYGAPWCL